MSGDANGDRRNNSTDIDHDNIKYPLVDIGPNLCLDDFRDDLEQVLQSSKLAGVCHLILTTLNEESAKRNLEIIHTFQSRDDVPKMSMTIGCHPGHMASFRGMEYFRQFLLDPETRQHVVAIGETGLDDTKSDFDMQISVFEQHLELASEFNLPLFLHERKSHVLFLDMLKMYIHKLHAGGVVHCFNGSAATLKSYIDLGLYIGITGVITQSRMGKHLREIMHKIPLDRLLIETDCPSLAPNQVTKRTKNIVYYGQGKVRNEPRFLCHVSNALNRLLFPDDLTETDDANYNQIATITTANALRLFQIKV